MAIAVKEDTLSGGMLLRRHHDPAYNVDQQAGPLSYWQSIEQQVLTPATVQNGVPFGGLAYFNNVAGISKLAVKVALNIYPPSCKPTDLGSGDCLALGDGRSRIRLVYSDPARDPYWLPAALSHELGHAFSNWCRLYSLPGAWGPAFAAWWERACTVGAVPFNPQVPPWNQGYQHPDEMLANAFRFFNGAGGTRGVAGAGTREDLAPGFVEPSERPEWGKMLRLLPETCGFWAAHGLRHGSLAWLGGATGYWQFQRGDGVWIAQTDYYTWHIWDGSKWSAFQPQYSVS